MQSLPVRIPGRCAARRWRTGAAWTGPGANARGRTAAVQLGRAERPPPPTEEWRLGCL